MQTRLTAMARLATELASVTVSMGGLLLSADRERSRYYEDHF